MEIKDQFTVPLAEAAHRLGWSWSQAFNAILRRQLGAPRWTVVCLGRAAQRDG
jgi:hypothetical protein